MRRPRWMARIMIPVLAAFLCSCGGGGGGGSSSQDIPENFNELANTTNTQSKTLTLALKDFAEKYNAAITFDPATATGNGIVKPLNDLVASAEALQTELAYYDALLEAYDTKITEGGGDEIIKALGIAKQSVDPLLINDIANLIENGKAEADAVQQLIDSGEDPDLAQQAYNEYVKKNMVQSFNLGVTALVGGGAGLIAGLAASSAGAPVLVATGIGVGVGMIAGAVWSWCTAPDTTTITKATTDEVCAIAGVESQVVQLSNGQTGIAIPLPQGGPGTLCVHIDGKAPLCFTTTVDAGGNTIVTGCFADAESGTPSEAGQCEVTTTEQSGITILGTDCADVTAVTASAAVGGVATVTATVIPPTNGCTVNYSVAGTDGYAQAGSPSTSGSGTISFTVPAGVAGVHDSVVLTVSASGATTTIGYSF